MKGRREHPAFDEGKSCVRCGCDRRDAYCPPGFWMTPSEHWRWDALNRLPVTPRHAAQSELEHELVKEIESSLMKSDARGTK